mmetsp:Transcript_17962/g.44053  ORF Transcript_17962/g.44053 Transcript_17962/m.44053 type:complete len:266 (+) Transcript_17962:314-1111(+)
MCPRWPCGRRLPIAQRTQGCSSTPACIPRTPSGVPSLQWTRATTPSGVLTSWVRGWWLCASHRRCRKATMSTGRRPTPTSPSWGWGGIPGAASPGAACSDAHLSATRLAPSLRTASAGTTPRSCTRATSRCATRWAVRTSSPCTRACCTPCACPACPRRGGRRPCAPAGQEPARTALWTQGGAWAGRASPTTTRGRSTCRTTQTGTASAEGRRGTTTTTRPSRYTGPARARRCSRSCTSSCRPARPSRSNSPSMTAAGGCRARTP